MTGFTVEIDQNSYLPAGVGRVDAIVTVQATDTPLAAPPADGLEIIILDCSTSMSGDRISAARRAAAEAIAQVRDGVAFAVIAGTATAEQVYPTAGTATSSGHTRAEATARVQRLRANGATGIGTWLTLAGQLADRHGAGVRHAILLTDGQNGERAAVFQSALDAVVGRFTCDCRGVGTDWRVDELRAIASALLGTVDIVADPADLAADFRAIMSAAMEKTMAGLALRLWTPRTARVKYVKQVAPTIEDLTARRTESGNLRGDYPLGSWGAESRDYHVCVELVPGVVGEAAVAAARVSIVRGDEVLGKGDVLAQWTDDTTLSTRSAAASRSTPGRPSWPTRSRRASPRRRGVTCARRPRAWAGRSSWPRRSRRPRATTPPRGCWPRSSTSTRSPAPRGCGPRRARPRG
jgi:hypothetical protein